MICFEAYNNPKMLNCAHTFCADCLIGYQTTYEQQRSAIPGKLPCPTCRELTTLPSGGIDGLRNDFKVQKMEDLFRTMYVRQQEQQQLQQQQKRASGFEGTVCGPCQAQKKTRKGTFYCIDCSMCYCETCLAKHNRNTLFTSHKITSPPSPTTSSLPEVLYCKKHPQEQGRYVCQTCHTIVCTVCIVNDHADHNVVEMNSVLQQQQRDVQSLQHVMQSKNEALQKRLLELEALRQANQNNSQRAEATIADKAKQTIESIRQQQASLIEQLRRTTKERLASIDSELERIRYNISRTQAARDFASSAARSASIQMMAVHDELMQRMRTVADGSDSTSANGDDGSNSSSIVSFVAAANLGADLLGRIEVVPVTTEELSRLRADAVRTPPKPAPKVAVHVGCPPVNRQELGRPSPSGASVPVPVIPAPIVTPLAPSRLLLQAGRKPRLLLHVHSYGDKIGQLKDPLSVVCLPGGQLVVSEYGNKRLQLFDGTGQSRGLIAAGQIGPQGIASTLKGNVIASDTLQKRMQVFNPVDGQSLSKWGLGKFFSPCGVAVSANGNCVVTDIGDHSVSVYRGEQTCVSRFGMKGSRDDQFDNPLYVATGPHNEIIVSDSNNHCIKVFDSVGQFVRKIGSEGSGSGQFKFPRGVHVTADGHVLVADRNNDRVSVFSLNGRFVRHVVSKDDGVKAPYAVCLSPAGNVVLTESGNNRAAVKVFQL
jgi:DNA-binding beta-propeller fold protein YncE